MNGAHLNLMPVDAMGTAAMATNVAVKDGDWFDPGTWAGGQVPGDGALVHIPAGIAVTYQGASDASLFMVRVDGGLTFTAEDGVATKMVVDTMITSRASTLVVDARDPDAGTVDIEFAEGTPAAFAGHYTDRSQGDGVTGRYDWDPEQLSLGLVASGIVDIKGQDVEARAKLAAGPAAGATEIVLDLDAGTSGWMPGQQIVIGGVTFSDRNADGTMTTEDEVRTITDVRMEGGRMVVTLDEPLDYDHSGPVDRITGLELTGYVGNMSRNVTFSSAVADQDGDGVPDRGISLGEEKGPGEHYVTERGHIMFMHNDDVSVVDIATKGLGRTDKSIAVDDTQTGGIHDSPLYANGGDVRAFEEDLDIKLTTAADEMINPRARYPLHMHMANKGAERDDPSGDQDGDGIANSEDADAFDGAWIEGVAVWGSPGWGIVQHDTDAVLKDNVVFDVAGSAFVSENGNETGRWTGNLAIGTYGARDLSDNTDSEQFNGDGGASGNGFYMKSRALEVSDNVAQSSARAGFMWHTEGGDLKDPMTDKLGEFGVTANNTETIRAERVPILGFEDNEVIAARQAIRILASPEDSVRKYNDVYSQLKDFTAWEIDEAGVSITYSSKYIFENFLILGTDEKQSADAQQTNAGFYFKASVADITVLNSHVENFDNAVTNWTQVGDRQEIRRGYWDPKNPASNPYVEFSEGMGHTDGIDSAAYNLWNTNIVGLTYDNLVGGPIRVPGINIRLEDGTIVRERGFEAWDSVDDVTNPAGVKIELLGDSAAGGLVALWREDIANNPDQKAMLQTHIPLAYQNKLYLGQFMRDDGSVMARWNYTDYVEGINDDIWSGTVLEFAKTDSLGRQVFNYGDFSPMNPAAAERTVTTNERLVLSKEEVDATLVEEGYYSVRGIGDVKFVIMREQFSDRLTGETITVEILVALDLAWEMPPGARDAGLLVIHDRMLIAPEYGVFRNGVLVEGRQPITLAPPENTHVEDGLPLPGTPLPDPDAAADAAPEDGAADDGADAGSADGGTDDDAAAGDDAEVVIAAGDDAADDSGDALFGGAGFEVLDGGVTDAPTAGPKPGLRLVGGDRQDLLQGGDGADLIQAGAGHDSARGGDGDDTIDGGAGFDVLDGGAGRDVISGGWGHDTIRGGDGDDMLSGNQGNDVLYGGNGADVIDGGNRADRLFGGADDDVLLGREGADRLHGDDGNDVLIGEDGWDRLFGGAGDDYLSGGADGDRLFGGEGSDRIAGGTGDDTLEGGAGADSFVFERDAGIDVITDFEDGVDAIEFMVSSFGFDDLKILRDDDDTVIEHGEGQVRLLGVDADSITIDDFTFIGSG